MKQRLLVAHGCETPSSTRRPCCQGRSCIASREDSHSLSGAGDLWVNSVELSREDGRSLSNLAGEDGAGRWMAVARRPSAMCQRPGKMRTRRPAITGPGTKRRAVKVPAPGAMDLRLGEVQFPPG